MHNAPTEPGAHEFKHNNEKKPEGWKYKITDALADLTMPDNKQKGKNTLRYFLEVRNTPQPMKIPPKTMKKKENPPNILKQKKKSIQTPPKPRKLEAQKSMMREYFEKFQKGDTSTPPSDNGTKMPHTDSEKPIPPSPLSIPDRIKMAGGSRSTGPPLPPSHNISSTVPGPTPHPAPNPGMEIKVKDEVKSRDGSGNVKKKNTLPQGPNCSKINHKINFFKNLENKQKQGPPLKKSTGLENIHSLSLKKGLSGLVRQELDQSEASYKMQVGRGDES